MNAQQRTTIVGVFADHKHADQAVADLRQAGFRNDQIGVAMRHDEARADTTVAAGEDDTHAGTGALTGAMAGLGLGALAGLGVLSGMIPVIGPAIAGGTLGILLSNAAAGAGIAGLVGALVGAGIPEDEATYYQNEFEAGRTIVTVTADGRADEATTILRRHGAYDMSTKGAVAGRASTSTSTSAASTSAAAVKGTATHTATHAHTGEADTIRLKEEKLHAEKRPVETGEVRVRKEVHTEHQAIDVPVQHEEVVIERRAAHGEVPVGEIREGEEIRIPVREEKVDVSKHAVVTEEVKVGKHVVQDTERVTGDVRKEEVKVERKGDVDIHTRGNDPRSK